MSVMTRWKKFIDDTYLPSPSAELYAAPAGYQDVVTSIWLCNTNTTAVTVSVYIKKSGGTEAKGTILSNYPMAADEAKPISLGEVLYAGDSITGVASVANKVTIRSSGYERNIS